MVNAKWRKNCRGVNQSWHFELALLPEEILDFLPWIVSLIESQDNDSTLGRETPPHPLQFKLPEVDLGQKAWTQKAWTYYTDSELVYL